MGYCDKTCDCGHEHGKIIEDLRINGPDVLDLYRRIPKAPRDMKTTLYYRRDRSVPIGGTVFVHCCCEHGSLLSKPVKDNSLTMFYAT